MWKAEHSGKGKADGKAAIKVVSTVGPMVEQRDLLTAESMADRSDVRSADMKAVMTVASTAGLMIEQWDMTTADSMAGQTDARSAVSMGASTAGHWGCDSAGL